MKLYLSASTGLLLNIVHCTPKAKSDKLKPSFQDLDTNNYYFRYSSNRITAHQNNTKSGLKTMNTTEEKNAPKTINPSSDTSYTVNNMYRKDVSLGNSSPGTSWNLFGVNIDSRGPASNSLENTRARIFPS